MIVGGIETNSQAQTVGLTDSSSSEQNSSPFFVLIIFDRYTAFYTWGVKPVGQKH